MQSNQTTPSACTGRTRPSAPDDHGPLEKLPAGKPWRTTNMSLLHSSPLRDLIGRNMPHALISQDARQHTLITGRGPCI
eukprot:4937119-Lingulodinium_polyedra.AAC.1